MEKLTEVETEISPQVTMSKDEAAHECDLISFDGIDPALAAKMHLVNDVWILWSQAFAQRLIDSGYRQAGLCHIAFSTSLLKYIYWSSS
jgi:hypothetical protein